MVERVLVGARYGWRDWLVQRVTAVVMAIYAVILAVELFRQPAMDFNTWRGLWATPWLRYATMLFFLSLAWHAWVGMRDIMMDYVGNAVLRLALHSVVILLLVCYTVWAMRILWGI